MLQHSGCFQITGSERGSFNGSFVCVSSQASRQLMNNRHWLNTLNTQSVVVGEGLGKHMAASGGWWTLGGGILQSLHLYLGLSIDATGLGARVFFLL